MKTVVVTWMDRSQETYTCDSADTGTDRVLRLYPRGTYSSEPVRCIPLDNVRIYTVGS